MDEREILNRHLRPLTSGFAPARGLMDDTAILDNAGFLSVTTDTSVEGVHFPVRSLSAEQIARRALRVNLSDLAATGAKPLCYFLGLQLPPETDDVWMTNFASGLKRDQDLFDIRLAGGDTVRTPGPLAIAVTAVGQAGDGRALDRSGAEPGDVLLLTGTIGDALLGRWQLEGRLAKGAHCAFLAERFALPTPRLELARLLAPLANAAIDISDGLVADLEKLCSAAGQGARMVQDQVPLSNAADGLLRAGATTWSDLVTGGDDYEVLFSVPAQSLAAAMAAADTCGVRLTRIGEVTKSGPLAVLDSRGTRIAIARSGHQHEWNRSPP